MAEVFIYNLSGINLNEEKLKQVCLNVLKQEKRGGSVDIYLVGRGKMRNLNKVFHHKNAITDVLSFPENEKVFILQKKTAEGKENFLGEVFVCPARVRKNSRKLNLDFEAEILKTALHGILHLMGYTHDDEKEAAEMKAKERKYIQI